MSQFNFWSVTAGYDVKYLLAIIFEGGNGLFGFILAALLLQLCSMRGPHATQSKTFYCTVESTDNLSLF